MRRAYEASERAGASGARGQILLPPPVRWTSEESYEEDVVGRLQNSVVATVSGVSQFYKYKPEDYLKQPLYGRDVPPCRHC